MRSEPWSTAEEILRHLKEFNRKERFFVVGMALGNQAFELDSNFREKLGHAFEVNVPEDAFAPIDYHLDWIYASLFLSSGRRNDNIYDKPDEITATQQDIEFLVAFADKDAFHIIMLEAKGDSPFTNSQLENKVRRLEQIFGSHGRKWAGVSPHLALMSPYKPKRLKYHECPTWIYSGGPG